MPINFPTSLDALTNPVAGDATNNVTTPHATQHANSNDAIEALEARVGITGSAVTSSLTYRIATVETTTALLQTGAWTTWTPVVTQSATPTMTISEARYVKNGRTVTAELVVSFTSAGTNGNAIQCTLPVAGATYTGEKCVGQFSFLKSASAWYTGSCVLTSATALRFRTNAGTDAFGINPAITIGSADTMTFTITYDAAS